MSHEIYNQCLIEHYPFLLPRDWDGKPYEDYDYSYTLLDDMPEGWRSNFGLKLCLELKRALVKAGKLNTYQVTEIKEKYGGLRWYDYGGTEETRQIIRDYEDYSFHVCMNCGAPAKHRIINGWIFTLCDKCAEKNEAENMLTNEE